MRALVAVGNDDRDRLAVVVDLVVLQREEALPGRGCADERGQQLWLAGNWGQVVVGQDGDDPVSIEGSAAIDGGDPPAGDRRADDRRVRHVRQEDFSRVAGAAHRFFVTVETRDGLADRPVMLADLHRVARRPRTIARSASATLKALPRRGCGGGKLCGRRLGKGLVARGRTPQLLLPRGARATAWCRHHRAQCAHQRQRRLLTVSAAQIETRANSYDCRSRNLR